MCECERKRNPFLAPSLYEAKTLAFLQPPTMTAALLPPAPMPTGPILVGELEKPQAFPVPDSTTTIVRTLATHEMTQPISGIRDNIAIAAHVDGNPVAVALDAAITKMTGTQALPVISSILAPRALPYDTKASLLSQTPIGTRANQLVIERIDTAPAPVIDTAPLDVFAQPEPVTYSTNNRKKWAIIAAAAGLGAFFLLRGK